MPLNPSKKFRLMRFIDEGKFSSFSLRAGRKNLLYDTHIFLEQPIPSSINFRSILRSDVFIRRCKNAPTLNQLKYHTYLAHTGNYVFLLQRNTHKLDSKCTFYRLVLKMTDCSSLWTGSFYRQKSRPLFNRIHTFLPVWLPIYTSATGLPALRKIFEDFHQNTP